MSTIKDVAQLSGTSITSVSKVLSGKEIRISPQKRQAIVDAAKQLNYVPNSVAANLKRGKPNTVAILCPDLSDPYYPKLAKNIIFRLEKIHQRSVIYDFDNEPRKAIDTLLSLRDGSVNSILIICNSALTSGIYATELSSYIEDMPIPVLLINGGQLLRNCISITYDLTKSGMIMAEHLLSMGHTTFGVITDRSSAFDQSFCKTIVKNGATVHLIEECHRYDGGYEACRKLYRQGVTAIAAASDQLAIGALSFALKNNISVPQQLAITGVGDLISGRIFPVPITTLRYSAPQLAEYTVDLLQKMQKKQMEQDITRYNVLLTPKLLVRSSSDYHL